MPRTARALLAGGYYHLINRGNNRSELFPIQHDAHLLTVMRYVERNALRAGLVNRAEEWPWGSLAWRTGTFSGPRLAEAPVPVPVDWVSLVNAPQTTEELLALRTCVNRQRPFGDESWSEDTATRLGLSASRRARGRPRRPSNQEALPLV